MPGKIIKLFDTQADWQSGTISNMDSTTKPGSIAPNPSFSKTYTVNTSLDWYNWKQGASIQFVYEEGELVNPQRMIDDNITTYAQKMPMGYTALMVANYSTARQFSGIQIYQGPLAKGRVRLLRGTAEVFGWTSLTASGGWKTINFSSAQDTIWILEIRPGTIIYEIDLLPTDYYITPKTWTSSWDTFGISGSFTSTFTLNATIPSGTSVTKYVRYSSTGQDNPTWQEITGSSLPGTGGNYIQFKIELSTTDTSKTPTVNSFSVTAGPEVYWISPFIDTSRAKSDRLTIGVETDMDIKRSIKASNYTFARPSVAYKLDGTQVSANVPRFEQGKFGKAIMVEEGTTNLFSAEDSSFEGGTIGNWTTLANAVIITGGWHGAKAVQVTATASNGRIQQRIDGTLVNLNDTVTLSTYTKLPNGAAPMDVTLSIAIGGVGYRSVTKQITSDKWTRLSVTTTLDTLGSGVYAQLFAGRLNSDTYGTVIWDAIQLEKKPYATSFVNGTRAAETLTIPTAGVLNPQEGTVECWVYFDANSLDSNRGNFWIIGTAKTSYADRIILQRLSSNIRFQVSSQVSSDATTTVISFPISDITIGWHYLAARWTTSEIALFLDGVKKATANNPNLPQSLAVNCGIGYNVVSGAEQCNTLIDDLRISSIARSDAEILANYQSGQPVGFDSYATYYEPFDGLYDWQVVGVVFENPHTVSLQVKIEPSKTKIGDQYIDSLGLWDTITLPMLERPDIELAPPECNKVTVYTDTIEKSATVPGTSSDRIVEIRVEAPEGSSEAYCQQMADAILAAKSKERLSITCKVPLVTSLRFGELVPVILPYIGATIDTPYLAHVQRMEHHILENPPYTILSLGDFLPDDIEALVRLLKEG